MAQVVMNENLLAITTLPVRVRLFTNPSIFNFICTNLPSLQVYDLYYLLRFDL